MPSSIRFGHRERAVGTSQRDLGGSFHPSSFFPDLHSVGAFGTVLVRLETMALGTEVLPNWPESSKETSIVASRLKPAHRTFALACGLMRILGPSVSSPVLAMFYVRQYLAFGRPITAEFIGDQHARHILTVFEELPKEPEFLANRLNREH